MPTHNPHLARALGKLAESGTSPFSLGLHHIMSAAKLSRDLETNLYFTTDSLHRISKFRPKQGDVIVSGLPRSGLTPILRALDALKRGTPPAAFSFDEREALADRVMWIENDFEPWHSLTSPINSPGSKPWSGRLLRTHMPVLSALHGDPCPRGVSPMYKAVVVLRDPADVRVSWFRHLRRIYKRFHPDDAAQFDYGLKLDDFAKLPVPRSASIIQDQYPENQIHEALKFLNSPQICIVFYEELLIDARRVVERLATFCDWNAGNHDLIDSVAAAIEDDESAHPKWGRKRGSSGAGMSHFSPASLRFIEQMWISRVRVNFNQFISYDSLYRQLTQQIYPLPVHLSKHQSSGSQPRISPRNSASSGLIRGLSGFLSSSRRSSMDESNPSLHSAPSYQNLMCVLGFVANV